MSAPAHGPHAERRLEEDDEDQGAREQPQPLCAQREDPAEEDQQPQRAGEVAVRHLLPGAAERVAAEVAAGQRLPVAERPVGAAEARVRKTHVRAEHYDDESEDQRHEEELAPRAHPNLETLMRRCRSFSIFDGSGSRG